MAGGYRRRPGGYREIAHLPEDGRRYEIHGGELVVVPSPLPHHQLAAPERRLRLLGKEMAE